MSKQSKKRARRRKQKRQGAVLLCSNCLAVQEMTAETLFDRLSDALNAFGAAGMKVRVVGPAIAAEGVRGGGYVLPPLGDSGWTRHMVTYNPSAHHLSRREDEIDS